MVLLLNSVCQVQGTSTVLTYICCGLIHSLQAGAGDRTVAHVRAKRKLVILDKVCLYLTSLFADRALAQAFIHWPFTRQAQFRSKASLCGFCGGQSDAGTGFSLRTLLLPCHYQCHGCVSATQCSLCQLLCSCTTMP